jgi:ribosomal protein S18 acetylase RimI-like enzyme
MEIRSYTSADREQVALLWRKTFSNSTGHNDPFSAIDRKVDAHDGLFFVAVTATTIVGTILAGYDGHRGWLYSVAVHKDYRRQGVGSLMVRHAESALVQLGCPKLNLQVRANNSSVTAFYQSLGFEPEERISMGKLLGD